MLPTPTMPMPGALRLRSLHPLIEGDGSCSLIYDLERAAVVEVPEDLQFHVAPALETGDLDEALLGWLVNEDLLTSEGGAGWSVTAGAVPLPEGGWWSLGAIYRIDDELHVRIDQAREDAALEVVGFVFKQGFGASRVKLHLNWGGAFPGTALLERIVVESSRLAALLGQEIAFELTLAAREVTPLRAAFLAGYGFQVRLLCGSYPAPDGGFYADLRDSESGGGTWDAEAPVRLLHEALKGRLTVHCVLDRGRLLDLWEWAKRTGLRHLDATVLEDAAFGDGAPRPGRLREVRNDLLSLCDEMADELGAQRLPVDFKPLTRIVDRLMRSEPLGQAYGERGSFASSFAGMMMPMADACPRSFFDSLDLRPLPDLPDGVGEEPRGDLEAGETSCLGCWARHACGHSTYVTSPQDDDARGAAEDRCPLWRTEVEVALRFYHRLAHMDPIQVRQFFDQSLREPAPSFGRREDLGHLRMPF
jgi:hypothetical protein